MLWPRAEFVAAVDSSAHSPREIIDVFQPHLNTGFSLLRKLVDARSFGELELQAAQSSNQVAAMITQSEESPSESYPEID